MISIMPIFFLSVGLNVEQIGWSAAAMGVMICLPLQQDGW
jgi:hypothetical protein